MDRMRELFALYRKPSHNHSVMHQIATSTSERELFALLPRRVENLRSVCVALP